MFFYLADGGQHFLSVAHVTGDCVDFITPGQVTNSHVTVDISGFSCFGLVTPAPSDQIAGLVLIFSQPTNSTLFVLLLPRNVCLTQVSRPCLKGPYNIHEKCSERFKFQMIYI